MDTIKNYKTAQAFVKYWFVVQAFNDKNHKTFVYVTTVKRLPQKLFLSVCALNGLLQFFSCDVSKAYMQAENSTQP